MAKKITSQQKPKTNTKQNPAQNRQNQKGRTTPLPTSQLSNKPKKK